MAQALEKRNVPPKLTKMIFCTKNRYFSRNSVFDEIQFSQKSLIYRKNQPHILPQQILVQQTPILFSYYKVRNCREAAVPENETKTLKEGYRGDRGSQDQNENPDLSNAL